MDALGVVQRIGNGHLLDDLAEALAVVAEEVVATGKAGQVALVLKIAVQQQGDPMVIVSDQITKKPPKRDPRGVLLYAVEGGLYTRDPRQVEMDFRAVATAPDEIRESAGGAAVVREA